MKSEIVSGADVRRWRTRLLLSQTELGQALGRTRGIVGLWETGKSRPPKWLRTWFVGYEVEQQKHEHFRSSRYVNNEKQRKVLEAYRRGDKIEAIRTEFGCGIAYPNKLAKRLGLEIRPRHRPSKNKGVLNVS